MKRLLFQIGLLFVFLVSVSFAQDSTLAEVAKKEKERRAKLKASKTFTNKDVEEWKAKQKSSGALIEGESAAPAGEGQTAESETAQPSKEGDVSNNEEYWRKKAQDADERLKKAEEKVNGVQSDINALNRAWYSGDMDDQRRQVEYERGKRLEDIETAKKELEEAKQAQEGLEDEARQAGAPPGWVRSDDQPESESEKNPEEQQQ